MKPKTAPQFLEAAAAQKKQWHEIVCCEARSQRKRDQCNLGILGKSYQAWV